MLYLFLSLVISLAVTYAIRLIFWREDPMDSPKTIIKLAAVFIGTNILLAIQPYTIHRVDAGNVGIQFHMAGDERGVSRYEYVSGYVVYNTWFVKLYEFPTWQQHVEYDEQTVITKGGLSCDIKPSFNYSLKKGDVGDMFVNLRLEISAVEKGWLKNAIVGTVNDVANRWAVDSIFNHRQEFEANIVADVNRKVAKWFAVSQMRTNIVPPKSLTASIEAKTNSLQQAQVAENDKRVQRIEGEAREIKAKADSAVAVTTAAGEARAIKEKQISLTPIYIQYIAATRWNGALPTTQLSGSTPFLFQPK